MLRWRNDPEVTCGLFSDRPPTREEHMAWLATLGDDRDLPIVYEDDTLVVLNKPAGLLAVPLPLRRRNQLQRLRMPTAVEEQIDFRGTAAGRRSHVDEPGDGTKRLLEPSRDRHLDLLDGRHAVVYGHPSPSAGTWRDHLVWDDRSLIQKETHPRDPRGKEAISHYRVLEPLKGAALIEVRLVTGRRNQIRIQARLRGHTLVGEQRYTYGPDTLRSIAFPRQALHAHRLTFKHPVDGRELRYESPLPHDLIELIARLKPSRSGRS